MVSVSVWPDPSDDENIAGGGDHADAVAPHSEAGGYVDVMDSDDDDRVRADDDANYDRLLELEREYDPDDLFRVNQNLEP
jgi:hypothetical protein